MEQKKDVKVQVFIAQYRYLKAHIRGCKIEKSGIIFFSISHEISFENEIRIE